MSKQPFIAFIPDEPAYSVCRALNKMHAECMVRSGEEPNACYLGTEVYEAMKREIFPHIIYPSGAAEGTGTQFMGMKVFRVFADPHHLSVAFILQYDVENDCIFSDD